MSEFEPTTAPEIQAEDLFRQAIGGRDGERMTSDVVGRAAEAADYVLHDAQLEGAMDDSAPAESLTDPQCQAAAIISRAVRNKTLRGLLGDISDAA